MSRGKTTYLPSGGAAHAEQGNVGDDNWSVFFVLCDFLRPFFFFFHKEGQKQPMGAPRAAAPPVREWVPRRQWRQKHKDWLWLARDMWHQQAFNFHQVSNNHGTIWITCSCRRAWWEIMFSFLFMVFLFYWFSFLVLASDWHFFLFFVCIHWFLYFNPAYMFDFCFMMSSHHHHY